MALIKCKECGKEISDKAPRCIHCGYPINDVIENDAINSASLIKCKSCGKEISNMANMCIHCGCPIEKKRIPLIIERESRILGSVLKVSVMVDEHNVGFIANGQSITVDTTVGTHYVTITTAGMSGNSAATDGKQIIISDNTKSVYVLIGFRYKFWTEMSGQTQMATILDISYN